MKKGEIFTLRKDRKEEAVRSDVMASEREYRWTVCAVIVLLTALCAAHMTDRPACECHLPKHKCYMFLIDIKYKICFLMPWFLFVSLY